MKFEVTSREVTVVIDDAPPVAATASYSSKVRTIRAMKATIRFYPQGDASAMLLGPQVRPNGSETASWYEAKVDVDQNSAQWLRDLVEAVR